LGKYRDEYFDPTETLIELVASYNDPDLPELAFVGLDTPTVKKKIGNEFFRKDNCFVYTKDNYALVLNITNNAVQCLKYATLKKKITEDTIPDELLKMNCTNSAAR
jgi:hypothetical protein